MPRFISVAHAKKLAGKTRFPHPTSVRIDDELRLKLNYQAEKEGRTRAQHIVHILRMATALVKVPKRFPADGGRGQIRPAEGGEER